MTGMVLFKAGKTNMVSSIFTAPAVIAGYNLTANHYTEDSNGLVTDIECGDKVIFERVMLADSYDIDCHGNIESDGAIASAPLLDECGNNITLTACNNVVDIPYEGTYRAIFIGSGRPDAIVTKD